MSKDKLFKIMLSQSVTSKDEPQEYVKYLDQVSVLDSLLAEEKKQVANALVENLGLDAPCSTGQSH